MKKILSVIMVVIVAATFMCVAVACGNPDFNDKEKTVTIVIGDTSHKLENTTSRSLLDGLSELGVDVKINSGFVSEIDNIKPNPANKEFLAFYTTIENPKYADKNFSTMYNDETLYSTLYGVQGIPLIDGMVYLFKVEIWA